MPEDACICRVISGGAWIIESSLTRHLHSNPLPPVFLVSAAT